ncbi:MAG: hypothetical protein HQ461_03810 [Deltaproteobacteria bacterium]|nr:hypothetical protein [Deltaproteobacteria bacterium]
MQRRSFGPIALSLALLAAAPSLVSFAATAEAAAPKLSPAAAREAELTPAVQTGLASTDASAQSWAIRAGARLKERTIQTAVVNGLTNTNGTVRLAAALAVLDSKNGGKARDAQAIFVNEIATGDAATRMLILDRLLLRLNENDRASVIDRALKAATDANIKGQIINHLARRTEPKLFALLDRFVGMNDAAERAIYLTEIRRIGRPNALRFVQALVKAKDPVKQKEGAELAIAINSLEMRTAIEPLLRSADASLAQRVGFHLAKSGNAAAGQLVRDLALNESADVALRLQSMALLRDNVRGAIDFDKFKALLDDKTRSPEFVKAVYEVLGAARNGASVALLDGLYAGNFAAEIELALYGYAYSGRQELVASLQKEVEGFGSTAMRTAAVQGLGHIGGEAATKALLFQLRKERVMEIKLAIVQALGDTQLAIAAEPLTYLFAEQNEQLSLAAISALVKLGSNNVSVQVESLINQARSPRVKWAATIALVKLDPAIGRIRLLGALERPPESFLEDIKPLSDALRNEVDENLVNSPDQLLADAALFRILKREDGGYSVLREYVAGAPSATLRKQAIAVVTAAGKPEDADSFKKLSEQADRSIRLLGFAALADLADPANETYFRGYINHADEAMRCIAAYALLGLPLPKPTR